MLWLLVSLSTPSLNIVIEGHENQLYREMGVVKWVILIVHIYCRNIFCFEILVGINER